jgi:hypothetical protein
MLWWFENAIQQFNDIDPSSTAFRYGNSPLSTARIMRNYEYWIDLPHLRQIIEWIARSVHKIIGARQRH